MTAKEQLEPLRTIDNEINSKLALRTQYARILQQLTQDYIDQAQHLTTDYSADHVQGDPQSSRVESIAVRMADSPRRGAMIKRLQAIDEDLDRQIDILVALKATAERYIDGISSPIHQAVLRYRYLNNQRWPEIARLMHYSLQRIYELHGRALQEYSKAKGE